MCLWTNGRAKVKTAEEDLIFYNDVINLNTDFF